MSASTTAHAALLIISLVMAIAMAVAWQSFGRPRHAASWGLAYAVNALQVVVDAGARNWPDYDILKDLAALLILISAALVATGVQQRAAPLRRVWEPLAAVIVYFALLLLLARIAALVPFLESAESLFAAVMTAFSATVVFRPGQRREPAEWIAGLSLGAFSAYQLLLGLMLLAVAASPANGEMLSTYAAIYTVGMPATFVASGVAGVLLIASDLAAQLRRLAAYDPLTGVHNRRGFQESALRALAGGRRQRVPIAAVLADIDHFKGINDRHGHTIGDRTLCFIAAMLLEGVRQGDLVARVGGEEFALLLIDSTADQARDAIDRVRMAIESGHMGSTAPVPVTMSFGVGAIDYTAGDLETALSGALDRADRALYLSKVEGRNRVTLAA